MESDVDGFSHVLVGLHDVFVERVNIAVVIVARLAEDGATASVVDVLDISRQSAIGVNHEVTFEFFVEAANIEYELVVEEDPDIIIAGEVEFLGAVSGDFDGNAKV